MSATPHDVVIAGPYRLVNATGYTGQGILGIAAPITSVGFAHAVERDAVARLDPGLRIPAVGVVVHEAEHVPGHPKYPPSDAKLAATRKGPVPGSEVIDEVLVRGVLTFVLAVDHVGDPYDRAERLAELAAAMPALLAGRPYAGGRMFREPGWGCSGVIAPAAQRAAVSALPRGHILRDRRDVMEAAIAAGGDRLQAALDLAAWERPADGGPPRKVVPGTASPVTVGYRAIEAPRPRRTNRTDGARPHAFCDSMTSIGEWVPTRRVGRGREGPPLGGMLWSHWADEDLGLYYASATAGATPGSRPCAPG